MFYYKNSEKGRQLAEILQKRFDYVLGAEGNRRSAKANDSYFLLLNVKALTITLLLAFALLVSLIARAALQAPVQKAA